MLVIYSVRNDQHHRISDSRFVGADQSSDEVVLMKIIAVLRTLMLTPVGLLMTNEMVCEILQSCSKICFESRLSDLLKKTAELALNDMIQLLFTRLPTFSEENSPVLKKLKMRNSGQNERKSKRKRAKDSSETRKQKQDMQKSPKPSKSREDATALSPTAGEKKSLDESALTATPGMLSIFLKL